MSFEDGRDLGKTMRAHLDQVEKTNADTIESVAGQMLQVIRNEGIIFTAGTGHSLALVMETFYRAGGLACVYPLYHSGLLPLNGGLASTLLERSEGLARLMLAQANPTQGDLAFVFSNSGVNPVPVELAQGLKKAGATVVGVVSLTHLKQAPLRAGVKLDQVADFILDTLAPYGDASLPINGGSTAPLSSLCSVFLWNLLLGRLAALSAEEGVEIPLWRSANVKGGSAKNESLIKKYRLRIPYL
jgi:uncharacterized phosphosugar-binding protein